MAFSIIYFIISVCFSTYEYLLNDFMELNLWCRRQRGRSCVKRSPQQQCWCSLWAALGFSKALWVPRLLLKGLLSPHPSHPSPWSPNHGKLAGSSVCAQLALPSLHCATPAFLKTVFFLFCALHIFSDCILFLFSLLFVSFLAASLVLHGIMELLWSCRSEIHINTVYKT